MFGWLAVSRSGDKPGFGPAGELLFFASPKKSNQKKGEPRPCRFAVPCATRSVRDTCKLASLEISTPLNRLRRFPLQGTTPAARQSRFRGAPGRGCAALASPWLLVRCAHLAGVGVTSFLYPHFSQGTARRATTPNPLIPHPSLRIMGNHKGCPYDLLPHSYDLTPHSYDLIPHSYDLIPHSSLLTPHSSLLTPHPSLLTPHSSLLRPHSSLLNPAFFG